MRTEWQGHVAVADSLAAGTFIFFSNRNQSQIGIRVDEPHVGSLVTKGLISLTLGYDDPGKRPAYFELSILSSSRIVYALPDVALALPPTHEHINLGRYGLDWGPGALAQNGDNLFLAVAYKSEVRFVDLNQGVLLKEWSPPEETVWFATWSVIRRHGDECKCIFNFIFCPGSTPP